MRELLRTRELTNTAIFPPSSSASGQAFDAAVSVSGLLMADNRLSPGLAQTLVERAATARTRVSAQPLEEILMDVLSLGQRLDWGQLKAFVSGIDDARTLALLTTQVRNAQTNLPTLFAAVTLSQKPAAVASYMNDFSQTGFADLGASLHFGEGGVDELLQRHERLYTAPERPPWMASGPAAMFFRAASDYALRATVVCVDSKVVLLLVGRISFGGGGPFCLAEADGNRGAVAGAGSSSGPRIIICPGVFAVVLLLSEPFLAQESQKAEIAIRLRLPMSVAATAGKMPLVKGQLWTHSTQRI